jgi:hypothetical protein
MNLFNNKNSVFYQKKLIYIKSIKIQINPKFPKKKSKN